MEIIGLLLSYGLLFILFIFSRFAYKIHLKTEISRKVVHIGISNWYIIALIFFHSVYIAIIPPLSFILFNYAAYRFHFMKSVERKNISDLGMVYYPISLSILVLISYGLFHAPYIGAIGTFIMGYGDGITALVGCRFGKKKIFKNKSLVGTITMFFISFLVTILILLIYYPTNILLIALTISFIATILELFSLDGVDNITVPLISSLIFTLFCCLT